MPPHNDVVAAPTPDSDLTREKRLAYASEAFDRLRLIGWTRSKLGVEQGGRSAVCVVRSEKGEVDAVFRCLPPDPTDYAVKRFRREVKALQSIDHPNIVKLLEVGDAPPHWYITPLGRSFKGYWDQILTSYRSDPGSLERVATSVLRQLASALAACHKAGLVHRDIKPKNLIVYERDGEAIPTIIDFGVVWMPDQEPLTQLAGDSVGNARYGADILRARSSDCPPWVDVFSLVQVFQWMICESDGKHHWQRPTHWRYVSYLNGLSARFCDGVRALSAVSSLEETCPRNGEELLRLIDVVLPEIPETRVMAPKIDETRIADGIAKGRQEVLLRQTKDAEALQAAKQLASVRYSELKKMLQSVEKSLPRVKPQTDRSFDELFPKPFDNANQAEYHEFDCRIDERHHFTIRAVIHAFVPSRWPGGGKPASLESANIFACTIERISRMSGENLVFPLRALYITLEKNGSFVLRDAHWSTIIEEISMGRLEDLLADMMSDPDAWAAISR